MRSSRVDTYPIPTACPYCHSPVIFAGNEKVYGRKYGNGMCYMCTACDAYVGVHAGTRIPLGRMANKRLRKLKNMAHAQFDRAWRQGGISRGEAYRRLAWFYGIPVKECHIGWFDVAMVSKVIEVTSIPEWWKLAGQEERTA